MTEPVMTPLCDLAKKHQTDKGGWHLMYGGCHSDTCHNYTPTYYEMFRGREDKVKRVIEVGINAGSSLRMWEEFFPNAEIYGLDINQRCLFDAGRIKCFFADQGSPESLKAAVQKIGGTPLFDLIIDDGSHEYTHQLVTANTLLPFVQTNGYYVIEDIDIDCKPERLSDLIKVPTGEFELQHLNVGKGIGKARCNPNCPFCQGAEGERLIAYHRK